MNIHLQQMTLNQVIVTSRLGYQNVQMVHSLLEMLLKKVVHIVRLILRVVKMEVLIREMLSLEKVLMKILSVQIILRILNV